MVLPHGNSSAISNFLIGSNTVQNYHFPMKKVALTLTIKVMSHDQEVLFCTSYSAITWHEGSQNVTNAALSRGVNIYFFVV